MLMYLSKLNRLNTRMDELRLELIMLRKMKLIMNVANSVCVHFKPK